MFSKIYSLWLMIDMDQLLYSYYIGITDKFQHNFLCWDLSYQMAGGRDLKQRSLLDDFTFNGNRQTTYLNKTMLTLQLMEIDKLP